MSKSAIDLSNSKRIVDMWRPDDFGAGTQGTNSWRTAMTQLCAEGNADDYQNTLLSYLDDLSVNENVYLLMEDGFPRITTQNTPSYPFEAGISKLENSTAGKIVGAVTAAGNLIQGAISGATDTDYTGISWQPWIRNAEAWKNSKGVKMDYTFKFSLGQYGLWNAYEEVVKPILNLAAPCLPRYQGIAFAEGPWPNTATMLGKILGELAGSISDVFKNIGNFESANKDTAEGTLGGWMTSLLTGGYKGFAWTMKFGDWMTFYHMLFENCTISFSNKVDENGWPIQGSIRINMAGVVPMALRANGIENLAAKFGK